MKLILTTLLLASQCMVMKTNAEEITDSVTVNNIIVTGSRYKTDIRHLPMTVSVINRYKLTENNNQNVLPTLTQQVPGLFATSRGVIGYGVSTDAAGGIKIRGIGNMADMLVLIDGLPQYAGLYGHPVADSYQTAFTERVEVIRGPASMIYGSNAMGGVVNIVTRQMQQDAINTNVNILGGSYGTFEANIVNRIKHCKFSSIIGANYSRTDGHRANSEFEQENGFMKLGYDFNPNWSLNGDVNVTYFESSNPGNVSNPYIDNDMMITRGVAAISLTNEYEKTSGAFRAYFNWGHHHINDGYHPGGTPQSSYYLHNDLMCGFSLYQSVSLFGGNHITSGIDFQHFGGRAWYRKMTDGAETDIINKSVNEVAGYVDFRQDITDRLTADAGVRIDYHSLSGSEWVPQGGLTFGLTDNAEIKAMVSKGFRNATIKELYMFRPANKDLEPERMMNYELSYSQHLIDGKLNYGINLFYLNADNLITTTMIDGKPLNVNTGKTENSGFELETDYRIDNHWQVNANYSCLHMSNPQVSAPEHKLFVGGNYRIGRFATNVGLQYIAGLYTATGINEQKEEFWLLNLTARYRMSEGVNIFAKGDNLLAQKYETVAGLPMPRATFTGGVELNF